MGRAVQVGECGASWFVVQASRYLLDGLQTTGMVRVEHLTRRMKQMDAFDFWEWAQSCRRQKREGQRPQRSKTAGNGAAKIPGLPFYVCNGEINTLRGNVNAMRSREGFMKSDFLWPWVAALLPTHRV